MAMLLRQAYDAQTDNVEADTVIEGLKYENAVLREALGLPKESEFSIESSGDDKPPGPIAILGNGGEI